ncbi:MAG: hypothetical protein ABSF28_12945 [Terracidiphilus sp.]|jgi:hypothetical protein
MSKIHSGCAPLRAERITLGFDSLRAYIPITRPVYASAATGFSDPPKGAFFTLKDPGKLQWLAAELVTKAASNTTMMRGLRSYDDRQVQLDDGFNLATIASGVRDPSVLQLTAALTSSRIEQLVLPHPRDKRED